MRETGTVISWKQSFGFIRPDAGGGKDVFVHFADAPEIRSGYRALQVDQRVSFEREAADRGPRAVSVELIGAEVA